MRDFLTAEQQVAASGASPEASSIALSQSQSMQQSIDPTLVPWSVATVGGKPTVLYGEDSAAYARERALAGVDAWSLDKYMEKHGGGFTDSWSGPSELQMGKAGLYSTKRGENVYWGDALLRLSHAVVVDGVLEGFALAADAIQVAAYAQTNAYIEAYSWLSGNSAELLTPHFLSKVGRGLADGSMSQADGLKIAFVQGATMAVSASRPLVGAVLGGVLTSYDTAEAYKVGYESGDWGPLIDVTGATAGNVMSGALIGRASGKFNFQALKWPKAKTNPLDDLVGIFGTIGEPGNLPPPMNRSNGLTARLQRSRETGAPIIGLLARGRATLESRSDLDPNEFVLALEPDEVIDMGPTLSPTSPELQWNSIGATSMGATDWSYTTSTGTTEWTISASTRRGPSGGGGSSGGGGGSFGPPPFATIAGDDGSASRGVGGSKPLGAGVSPNRYAHLPVPIVTTRDGVRITDLGGYSESTPDMYGVINQRVNGEVEIAFGFRKNDLHGKNDTHVDAAMRAWSKEYGDFPSKKFDMNRPASRLAGFTQLTHGGPIKVLSTSAEQLMVPIPSRSEWPSETDLPGILRALKAAQLDSHTWHLWDDVIHPPAAIRSLIAKSQLIENSMPDSALLRHSEKLGIPLSRVRVGNPPIERSRFERLRGNFQFVVLEDGALRLMRRGRHGWDNVPMVRSATGSLEIPAGPIRAPLNHSDLANYRYDPAGRPIGFPQDYNKKVLAAGEVALNRGEVTRFNFRAGHYRLDFFDVEWRDSGIAATESIFSEYGFKIDRSAYTQELSLDDTGLWWEHWAPTRNRVIR
jgi:hypothetical protein